MPGQQHSKPAPTHWVKGVCRFRRNLPPALLAERPGSFTCHCNNTKVEETLNKTQHTNLSLKKRILLLLLLGFKLTTFRSQVQRSTDKLFQLPLTYIAAERKKPKLKFLPLVASKRDNLTAESNPHYTGSPSCESVKAEGTKRQNKM